MRIILCILICSSALYADWVQIYEHSHERGRSWRLHLPVLGKNYLPGNNYHVGSIRRIGSQIKAYNGGIFYRKASSFRIWAVKSDITLYLFDGDHFNGQMLRFHVKKGHSKAIITAGWFDNRLRSLIAVREKEGKTPLEQLTDTPIPLDSLVDKLRDEFGKEINKSKDIVKHRKLKTQISYDTAHGFWTELGFASSYWAKYYDIIRIYHKISLDIKHWAFDYDAWIKLGYRFHVDREQNLHMSWVAWGVWVESGVLRKKILRGLASTVRGNVTTIGDKVTDGIRQGIEDEIGPLTDAVWNYVKKVGWKIPCDNFNNRSGYRRPRTPFGWASGSRKEMFPPTLILHHRADNP
ncbi:hypothetical protein [Candidatus Uabimicrobium amorphum]|uniref:Uncharacterized protein n=1 Tax=Uabimicrobium amorphum TaxID=2596890 RepID=A0A5S9INA3_UABAM|nr:hypothetical protein [Candidatus Uabimicrobium amorphum]BBM84200.1 hypothetical protein UABAM_02556 [Candidatus Uabimicrobium amorphum]